MMLTIQVLQQRHTITFEEKEDAGDDVQYVFARATMESAQ